MKNLILALAICTMATTSHAQDICGPYKAVVSTLSGEYKEVRRGFGLAGPKELYEIWASETTGNWTLLKIGPNGLACIIATGGDWHTEIVHIGSKA